MPESFDLVVVGSGVAGLAAASEAARSGARVLVLEGQDRVGGASRMSGGACCLVQTPLQEAHGISDSVELALADWVAMGGPTADLEWARRYLLDSRQDVYDWCEGLGVRWVSLAQPEGNSLPRWHLPAGWGAALVEALLDHVLSLGVEVRCQAPVTRLAVEGGVTRGVATTVRGTDYDVAAPGVVVATGGFVGDHDMVLAAAPDLGRLPRLLCGGSPSALGWGHRLLREVGARFVCLDQGLSERHPRSPGPGPEARTRSARGHRQHLAKQRGTSLS